jgi:hypothetical protein
MASAAAPRKTVVQKTAVQLRTVRHVRVLHTQASVAPAMRAAATNKFQLTCYQTAFTGGFFFACVLPDLIYLIT